MLRIFVINTLSFLILPFLLVIYKVKKYNFYVLYNSVRIGHFALNVDIFLRRVLLNDIETRVHYFLVSPSKSSKGISNRFLHLMQMRYVKGLSNIHYIANSFLYHILVNIYLKNLAPKLFYTRYYETNEVEFSKTDRILNFKSNEYIEGSKQLKQIGIDINNDKVVCIFARDDAYLKLTMASIDSSINWSYHNFRDMDVNNYIKSIKYLIDKGYKVIRVGNIAKTPVNYSHDNFLDYSFSDIKSDFMDLFLIYISHFVVGNSSGMVDMATLFNKPLLIVNGVPFSHAPLGKKDMYISKKIIDVESQSVVPFKKMINMNITDKALGEEQEFRNKFGLTYIDNTEEEIYSAIVDMVLYIDGKINCNDATKEYFSKYWNFTKNSQIRSLVSPHWLENNKNLYY